MSKKEAKSTKVEKKMFLGVQGEPSSYIQLKGQSKAFVAAPEVQKVEPLVRPGHVINRMNHNMTITYDGEAMVIAPRAREKVADIEKLGSLPHGVVVVPLT